MRFILSAFAGILVACLGLEVALRFLPVSSGVRVENSSPAVPLPRYQARQPYLYSFGWAMDNAQRGVINREGFANSRDFAPDANALVIGDSFIEGFMLDYGDSVQGKLDKAVGKVYAASMSGNGLADALVTARHYLPLTHARTVVLFVEPYDVRDIDGPAARGHNQFVVGADGVTLRHQPYVESSMKERMLKSSLLRYLYYNLKLVNWIQRPGAQAASAASGTAPTRQQATRRDQALAYLMTELETLQRQHGTRFVFLVDGDRNALYTAGKSKPNWQGDERETLMRHARDHGFAVVDMQPVFTAHWNRYRERMDWLPADGHWNRVAHELAARQLMPLLASPR